MSTRATVLSPSGRPAIKIESGPGTFTNGAQVTMWVSPDKENPHHLIVEVSRAVPQFTEEEILTEYRPWLEAVKKLVSKQILGSQYVQNEFREKNFVGRL